MPVSACIDKQQFLTRELYFISSSLLIKCHEAPKAYRSVTQDLDSIPIGCMQLNNSTSLCTVCHFEINPKETNKQNVLMLKTDYCPSEMWWAASSANSVSSAYVSHTSREFVDCWMRKRSFGFFGKAHGLNPSTAASTDSWKASVSHSLLPH